MARSLSSAWQRHGFDEAAFPELATRALLAAGLPERIAPADVIDWLVRGVGIPVQGDAAFGQPPVLVYRDDRFFIEVLFWLEGTTSLHAHGFSGAFQVLAGSSLHSTYAFDLRRRINSRFLVGEVRHLASERLTRGQARPIHPAEAYIHSLFHLDHPSVTIVVRTHGDSDVGEQLEYHAPHLAFASFAPSPIFLRQLAALRVLQETEPDAYLERACAWIRDLDLERAFYLMNQCYARPDTRPHVARLDGLLADALGPDYFDFKPTLREIQRQDWLTQRRRRIKDPRQRYLLALLLNVPRRGTFLELAAPGSDRPVHDVAAMLSALLSDPEDPALGLELAEGEREVLAHLLAGASDDAVLAGLAQAYDEVDRSSVLELCGALRTALPLSRILTSTEEVTR